MYEIEKNIPIEKAVPICQKYPFSKMEIGDSFVVDGKERFVVRAAAYEYARRYGVKFKTRAIKGEEKTRVWRTE